MCVKLNYIQRASEFPLAAKAVSESYVDDGLTGADSIEEVIRLQRGVQGLFTHAVFLLGKWNLSDLEVLQHIPSELRDSHTIQEISDTDNFAKTLGIEWNTHEDCFCLSIGSTSLSDTLTKRKLVSNITKTFGVLNPADCASRGLLPSELLTHDLWWNEPSWLSLPTSEWPDFPTLHQSGTWVSFSPTTCLYTQSILKLHTSYSCYCMGNEIHSCMSVDIQSKDNKLHKSNRCRH